MTELFQFFGAVGKLIEEFTDLEESNDKKREDLGKAAYKIIEEADDLANFLPGFIGIIVKQALDNGFVDREQEKFAYNVLGQWMYDRWVGFKALWKM